MDLSRSCPRATGAARARIDAISASVMRIMRVSCEWVGFERGVIYKAWASGATFRSEVPRMGWKPMSREKDGERQRGSCDPAKVVRPVQPSPFFDRPLGILAPPCNDTP